MFIAAAKMDTIRTRRGPSARPVARATAGVKMDCVEEVTVSHFNATRHFPFLRDKNSHSNMRVTSL